MVLAVRDILGQKIVYQVPSVFQLLSLFLSQEIVFPLQLRVDDEHGLECVVATDPVQVADCYRWKHDLGLMGEVCCGDNWVLEIVMDNVVDVDTGQISKDGEDD